jgi:hypothetical protein
MSKPELQTPTQDEGKGLRQLMGELKAALDEHDRLTQPRNFDDPRIAEQDRLNSLPEEE